MTRYQEPEFLPWDGRRVPITFVGGYLGAGKTTIINDVLTHADRPIAIIVNDVGSINIDASLIRKRTNDLIEVTNGCICCSSIDSMGEAFDQIRSRPAPPDHVLVELSGVAEPQRVLPWGQSAGFVLDGLVVVVAADQLTDKSLPELVLHHLFNQVCAADLLILTKTDLVDANVLLEVRTRLAQLAPHTPVYTVDNAFKNSGAAGRFLSLGGRRSNRIDDVAPASLFDAHDVSTIKIPQPVNTSELRTFIDNLHMKFSDRIVRAKGIVDTDDDGLILVQVVGNRCELTAVPQAELQVATDLTVITLRST
jgi:G3E family GTPase